MNDEETQIQIRYNCFKKESSMRSLHIAAAQIHSGGGIHDVLKRIECQTKSAAAVGVQVILFAEGALHGYDYHMTRETLISTAESINSEHCQEISFLAKDYEISILIGFFENDDGVYYNSQLVATPDGKRQVQRKHRLTPNELKIGLTPGSVERTIFEFNGVNTAIVICADTGIEHLNQTLYERGVDYQFIPTGGGGKRIDFLHERDLTDHNVLNTYIEKRPSVFIKEAVIDEKDCPYIGKTCTNALGPVGDITCHQGHCMIIDNSRVMRAQIPGTLILEHLQDQMIHAELNFK